MRNISKNSNPARSAAALLLTLIVAGCATDKIAAPTLDRDLPEYPAGLSRPADTPPLVGDARAVLAQTRTAKEESDAKLVCGVEWFEQVREYYRHKRAAPPEEADATECVKGKLTPPKPAKKKFFSKKK